MSVFNLIAREIGRKYPEIISKKDNSPATCKNASIPAHLKRNLLSAVWDVAGATAVLSIGQGLRNGSQDLIWRAAMRAENPKQLFGGWRRFEAYAHSTNRLDISLLGEKKASFRRYAVKDSPPPSFPENLLICGIVVSLLQEIGVKGLRCRMAKSENGWATIFENENFIWPEEDAENIDTLTWVMDWKELTPNKHANCVNEWGEVPIATSCNAKTAATVGAAATLVRADFLRQWTVDELAKEIGVSGRSLQRRLKEADFSFSALVRYLRIEAACESLGYGEDSIAAIGFYTGFSDSAHFSRDFRAAMGMTPSNYRDQLRLTKTAAR